MLNRLEQKTLLQNKQEQRLIITQEMKTALFILQMPILDLKNWLEEQISLNPILELNEKKSTELFFDKDRISSHDFSSNFHFSKKNNSIKHQSLFAILMEQAHENFAEEDLFLAETIIGNINIKGFLTFSITDLSKSLKTDQKKLQVILKTIQTFEPLGVGSRNIQEFLLLQCKKNFPEEKLLIKIINSDYTLFSQGKFQVICKKYKIDNKKINYLIETIFSKLNFYPNAFTKDETPILSLVPDIYLKKEKNKWLIEINHQDLPILKINPLYNELSSSNVKEEKLFYQNYKKQTHFLEKIIKKRKETLLKVFLDIFYSQKDFFENKKNLQPLQVKDVAKNLNLHETTIRRAIEGKYVDCPQGILPLKSFFSPPVILSKKVSKDSAKQLLKKCIEEEDKSFPLSDEEIRVKLHKLGIKCSRRTISKYRHNLLIGTALQRKNLRKINNRRFNNHISR
jgi:RNA polymerase sigma-54 factor